MSQPHQLLGLSSDNIIGGSRTRRYRSNGTADPGAATDMVSTSSSAGVESESQGGRRQQRGGSTVEVAKPRHITDSQEIHRLGYDLLLVLLNASSNDGTHVAEPFYLLPSRKQYPEYYAFIKRPISFNEILDRWRVTGHAPAKSPENRPPAQPYESFEAMRRDCDLISNNAKRFNEKGSPVYERARELTALVRDTYPELVITGTLSDQLRPKKIDFDPNDRNVSSKFVGDEESESSSSESEEEGEGERVDDQQPPKEDPKPALQQVTRKVGRPPKRPPTDEPDEGASQPGQGRPRKLASALRLLVKRLLEGRRPDGTLVSEYFTNLPSSTQFPDYYRTIKAPISLHEIEEKVDKKQYDSGFTMLQDLHRMIDNALTYNERGTLVWCDALWIRYLIKQIAIPAFVKEGFTLKPGDTTQVAISAPDSKRYITKDVLPLPPPQEWLPPDALNVKCVRPYHVSVRPTGLPPKPTAAQTQMRLPPQGVATPNSSQYSYPLPNRLPPAPTTSTPLRPNTGASHVHHPGAYNGYGLPASMRNGPGTPGPYGQAPRPGAVPMGMPHAAARPPPPAPIPSDSSTTYPPPPGVPAAPGVPGLPGTPQPPAPRSSVSREEDRTNSHWWISRLNPFAHWDQQLASALNDPAQSSDPSESHVKLENVIPYFVLELIWRPVGPVPPQSNTKQRDGLPLGHVRQSVVLTTDVTRQHLIQLGAPYSRDRTYDLSSIKVQFFLRDLVARQRPQEANGHAEVGKVGKPPPRKKAKVTLASEESTEPAEAEPVQERYTVSTLYEGENVPHARSILSLDGHLDDAAQTEWTAYSVDLAPSSVSLSTFEVVLTNVPRLIALPPSAGQTQDGSAPGATEEGRPRRAAQTTKKADAPKVDAPAVTETDERGASASKDQKEEEKEKRFAEDAKRLFGLLPERYRLFIQL